MVLSLQIAVAVVGDMEVVCTLHRSAVCGAWLTEIILGSEPVSPYVKKFNYRISSKTRS